jgi:hypothetical protein
LYEYYRPTFTVANDWFNKQAQIANGLPNVPGKLIRNIFGGDLGGPIKRDRLFFFANYEGVRQAENVQVSRSAPTASYQAGQVVYPDSNGNPVANHARANGPTRLRMSCLQHLDLPQPRRRQPKFSWLFQKHACGEWNQPG